MGEADITIREILPVFLAFGVSAVVTALLIPWLRRRKAQQTEREEGVASHLKKAGTPTMGGIAILIGIFAASLFFGDRLAGEGVILFMVAGFGLIGFLDDFLKVFLKRSDGLIAWQKLLLEIVVAVVFLILLGKAGINLDMIVPFSGGNLVSFGILGFPFAVIVILATVNGVNFTDGLDGLASTVTIIVAVFFAVASVVKNGSLSLSSLAVIGALLGFLVFNAYPAKIFMGDTGSLALGGFVAGTAYVLHMPLFIPIIGIIYAVELLSVAMQVTYFKATHGKRIFKMTPIHHHFELSGWSETQIVMRFCIITILTCCAALFALI
mgnify:CR=1 FL=1